MQIVCLGDNLQGMPKLFSGMNTKNMFQNIWAQLFKTNDVAS